MVRLVSIVFLAFLTLPLLAAPEIYATRRATYLCGAALFEHLKQWEEPLDGGRLHIGVWDEWGDLVPQAPLAKEWANWPGRVDALKQMDSLPRVSRLLSLVRSFLRAESTLVCAIGGDCTVTRSEKSLFVEPENLNLFLVPLNVNKATVRSQEWAIALYEQTMVQATKEIFKKWIERNEILASVHPELPDSLFRTHVQPYLFEESGIPRLSQWLTQSMHRVWTAFIVHELRSRILHTSDEESAARELYKSLELLPGRGFVEKFFITPENVWERSREISDVFLDTLDPRRN